MSGQYLAYFTLNPKALTARCNLCVVPKDLKYSSSSKTNLKTHIETVHRHDDEKMASYQKKGMQTIDKALAPFEKQNEITDAMVDLIVDDYLPISWPEKVCVRNFMKKVCPRWKPVCKKTVRAKIIQKGSRFSFDFQQYKAKFGKPSTTVDLWTSRSRMGFMAVSLHLQTNKHFETKVMDVAHIPTPHTAENIQKKFAEVVGQYGMNPEDLFKTVTDNASNMKKAFRVSLWEQEESNENEETDEYDEVQDMDVAMNEVFEQHCRMPCSIHTLQLMVNDIIAAMPQRYKHVLGKCKSSAKKQHQSQKLTEQLKVVLPEHCTTRWNGQWVLMKTVLENFEEAVEHFGFTESDRAPLSALVRFFAPFFQTTKMLEADKVATIHNLLPLLCTLERHIHSSGEVPAEFKKAALDSLEHRFSWVTHDPFLLSCTVLSSHGIKWIPKAPNVVLRFGDQAYIIAKVKEYLESLTDDLPMRLFSDLDQPPQRSTDHVDETSPDCMFGYGGTSSTSTADWTAQFDEHLLRAVTLSATLDPLAYWRAMPVSPLSVMAIQILGVPASSAPVERIFSTCGLICTSKRTCMKPDLLAALLRAKYNK